MSPEERNYWQRQAVLYVVGTLSAEENVAFEQRLGDSQEIRDLFVQAMQHLSQSWAKCEPVPTWREELRQRLRRRNSPAFGWLSLALSALTGAVVASLFAALILWWQKAGNGHSVLAQPQAEATSPGHSEARPSKLPASEVDGFDETALTYVDLTSNDRVAAVHQWVSERRSGKNWPGSSALHTPLVEYLSQPCPKQKHTGM